MYGTVLYCVVYVVDRVRAMKRRQQHSRTQDRNFPTRNTGNYRDVLAL